MSSYIKEADVEQAAMNWFWKLGYQVRSGPDLAPGEPEAERMTYGEPLLLARLQAALSRLNPHLPDDALNEAVSKVRAAAFATAGLLENNRRFHRLLVDGVDVEYSGPDGRIIGDKARLLDFHEPNNNDWLALNQFTVIENKTNRRPDVVVFLNGLPLAILELKNAVDENATVKGAFQQLQTYKHDLPLFLSYNALMVISDGLEARAGTLSSDWERFQPWRTINGDAIAAKGALELETLILGLFDKRRLLDMVEHFVVFEADDKGGHIKKMAAYHQFHAVNKAVAETLTASAPGGDRRAGVVWHTQGSGKSLSMAFYAGKVIRDPAMGNPTIVVLTDRADLDDQLFGTFAACQELLRQEPGQADSREDLRDKLRRESGSVIFTTIQKFLPEGKGERYPALSERRNIVFIADEAHRSQYNFRATTIQTATEAYLQYGYAQHMRDALPNASFIGFTGTPIEQGDRSTKNVFGDYIDTYDIQQAVEDGATVRIYYEARLAKLQLREEERPKIDPGFEEVTEGEEEDVKRKLKTKWAQLEAMVGTEKRISQIAQDIIEHFERRLEAMEGKAMIVCMSRRICVDLYDAIIALRPEWADERDDHGFLKVVMTGSATDKLEWQKHIRNKPRRSALGETFKDATSPIKMVIVRDMWLTGFDAPCLHTMYVDKPMQGHGLMQAIARVNRVFKDKPGGLIVDYLGLADQLKRALADYTKGDREEAGIPQEQAVAVMLEKYEVAHAMFHGFDYSKWASGTPMERLALIPAGMEWILERDPKNGRKRFLDAVVALARAFALAVPNDAALAIQPQMAFFQAVRAGLVKTTTGGTKSRDDLDSAVQQLVSQAITSNEIIDIFGTAGLKTPDISILSDEFLAEVRELPQRNLALEFLRKLLGDEIKSRSKTNIVQSRSFASKLEEAIRKYQNRSLEAAIIINELIEMAKELRAANERGETLGLTDDELAFYDALEVNDSAVKVLGDETLRTIARELVTTVKSSTTIDWTIKEGVRARLRTVVKRILRKYGYPPDKQEQAVKTILSQAEELSLAWT